MEGDETSNKDCRCPGEHGGGPRAPPQAVLLQAKGHETPQEKPAKRVTEEQKEEYASLMEKDKAITFKVNDKDVKIEEKFVRFERYEQTKLEEKYTPHVIEPSFGLGRIMYCIFEHCFRMREEDAQRTYFDFPV